VRATSPAVLAAVAAGGAVGAVGRHGVSVLAGDGWSRDVAATLTVNLVGSFLIGVVVSVLLDRRPTSEPALRGFLVTGVLGGFTTFSALALEVRDGLADDRGAATAGYVLVTLVAGPLLAALGLALGRRPAPPPHDAVEEPV
jgi:CrcB protein